MTVQGVKMAFSTTEQLVNYLGKSKKAVAAFERKFDPAIGEELVHRISGKRFFQAAQAVDSKTVQVGQACPIEVLENGYRGITQEQFEALKQLKIYKKEGAYGREFIRDGYTGADYWADKNTLGQIVPTMEDSSIYGRRRVPLELWNKIQSFFG